MGSPEFGEILHRVNFSAPRNFATSLKSDIKETLFPDDPFREIRKGSAGKRTWATLKYFLPILEWVPHYSFRTFRSDFIAGITIATLAIPQGISYAKLANIPPIIGLYSSFVPPIIYTVFGSSKVLAVGTVAAASLLTASIVGAKVSADEDPALYISLVYTATLFSGLFQLIIGFFRLGFLVDFLSHATIVGFMGGAATIVIMQQLKAYLGLKHFTTKTDLISVMKSIFSQKNEWRWESALLGGIFLFFLLLARYVSKKRPRLFWISAVTPLLSVIIASLFTFLIHAENHGIQIVGELKKGLNPISISQLNFSDYFPTTIKTGLITGFLALAEGIAVGRSFAMFKNDNIDGNKEMIAFGMMNIVGSCTSCYLTTGPFSRSAVNFNAGCKTAMSNVVMSVGVMLTLLFLTPLFHYTPLVVLAAIITAAMLGLIDYQAVHHLFTVDKFDFCVCMAAYLGVILASMDIGLMVAVGISICKALLYVARPGTAMLGSMPETGMYRDMAQYPCATRVPGILILQLGSPIYYANSSYLRERIARWFIEEQDYISQTSGESVEYVVLDLSGVTSIDTSGINMLDEVRKLFEKKGVKLALCNPRVEVTDKFVLSQFVETIGPEWLFLTVKDAVATCGFLLHTTKEGNKQKLNPMATGGFANDSNH